MTSNPSSATQPTVFISYSWDSEEHKQWVLGLALRLRDDSINVIIDQTHLRLGARMPEFMEGSVRDSTRVLVICTEGYKERFDKRRGGAGYEGNIITGEIINEVGKNKFIPVLRSGNWPAALPTALSGAFGVDLRTDSAQQYETLVADLRKRADAEPAPWPAPLPSFAQGAAEYINQRKKLPETELLKKIWSRPRWHIWIRPTQFRKARFQDITQCETFVVTSYVRIPGLLPYPCYPTDSMERGSEWIAGETDYMQAGSIRRMERWALFRSAQWIHTRAFDQNPYLGDRTHVLEILDTATAAFEFAARMAGRGVLTQEALITFSLQGVDGHAITWPQDITGDIDRVGRNSWAQDDFNVERRVAADDLTAHKRELGLGVAVEIYRQFGWQNPPEQPLRAEQQRRIGA